MVAGFDGFEIDQPHHAWGDSNSMRRGVVLAEFNPGQKESDWKKSETLEVISFSEMDVVMIDHRYFVPTDCVEMGFVDQ